VLAAGVATAAALLVLSGCGSAKHGSSGENAPASAPGRCPLERAVAGCEVVGVVFPTAQTLPQIEAAAAADGGSVVALWRTDAVCMPVVAFGAPPRPGQEPHRSDPFAYWHADQLVARQIAGPPVTDGGYSFRLRDLFNQEWQAVDRHKTTFSAAVFYVHHGARLPGRTTAVDSYRTDGANVLYLHGHDQAVSSAFPPATPASGC